MNTDVFKLENIVFMGPASAGVTFQKGTTQ